jgi:hypothetical protein
MVLVIVLLVTNLVTLGVLAWFLLRTPEHPRPDRSIATAIDGSPPLGTSTTATRRVITIEILNPIELAGTRGRIVGIAGSLAPGITRRIVYDQAIKTMKRHLADEKVVADVRVHTVRPTPVARPTPAAPPGRSAPSTARMPAAPSTVRPDLDLPIVDPAAPVDLVKRDDVDQDAE